MPLFILSQIVYFLESHTVWGMLVIIELYKNYTILRIL